MEYPLVRRFIRLADGHAIAQDRLAGRTVRIRRGRVWLTQYADARDYFLACGDELRIDTAGAVVMHALADAVVEVRAEAPAPAPRLLPRIRDAAARLVRRFRAASVPACPQ
jgi:hypothetical protein